MTSLRVLEGALLVLLVVTVALKVSVMGAPIGKPHDPEAGVAAFLKEHGFESIVHPGEDDPRVFQATRADCRVLTSIVAPRGWHRDVIRQLAEDHDRLFYVFRGSIYPEQPVFLTWTDHYWTRIKRSFGLRASESPAVAVILSSGCAPHETPWSGITETH